MRLCPTKALSHEPFQAPLMAGVPMRGENDPNYLIAVNIAGYQNMG